MAMGGLRASYHRLLGKIEHILPAKLRPVYNHPAGNTNAVSVTFNVTDTDPVNLLKWGLAAYTDVCQMRVQP